MSPKTFSWGTSYNFENNFPHFGGSLAGKCFAFAKLTRWETKIHLWSTGRCNPTLNGDTIPSTLEKANGAVVKARTIWLPKWCVDIHTSMLASSYTNHQHYPSFFRSTSGNYLTSSSPDLFMSKQSFLCSAFLDLAVSWLEIVWHELLRVECLRSVSFRIISILWPRAQR